MLSRWVEDWKHTDRWAQIVLVILSVLIVGASLSAALMNFMEHDYADAAGFLIPIVLLGLRFVIFPFRLAWAAKRRGGSFNGWFAGTLFAGFIIAGLIYLGWKSIKESEQTISAGTQQEADRVPD